MGAGLPVIATLKHLKETGDKIKRIEGIFSGTLSYIFNEFGADQTFSDIVKTAKEKGYTEPDPRDDLAGMDVARKVKSFGSLNVSVSYGHGLIWSNSCFFMMHILNMYEICCRL